MNNKRYIINSFSRDIDQATDIIESVTNEIGADEVLIKNKIVGINAIYDRELYRGGVPYINVTLPYTFGVESVGIVEAVGTDVKKIEVNQAVSIVKVGQAYQEYQVLNQDDLTTIPEATAEYLAINPTGVSADLAIEKLADIKGGELCVVSAAAGGLGHFLVQLLKMKGCTVVAICGTDEKVALLQSFNCCDRIINYRKENLSEIIDTEYRQKIDVAFDSVGRHIFDIFRRNMANLGRLIVCGLAAELSDTSFEKITAARVYEDIYWRGVSIRCFMNHLYKEDHPASRQKLFKLYQENKIKIAIDATSFNNIEGIREASHYLLAGKSCGKVVVNI